MSILFDVKISQKVAEMGLWPLIIVIVPNLFFRKYGQKSIKKRKANLYQAIAVFIVTMSASIITQYKFGDIYLYIITSVVIVLLVVFRKNVFPYTRKCEKCGATLDLKTIYYMEKNLCTSCASKEAEPELPDSPQEEQKDNSPENPE